MPLELLEDREMRRRVPNGTAGLRRIFDHHQPADEGTWLLAESLFPVGCPEVMSCSDGFLGTVVEIVAERWPDMAFQFDGCDQLALVDHQQIPQLCRAEVAGQGQHRPVLVNLGVGQTIGLDDIEHQGQESVHVLAACDASAFTLVGLA